MSEANRRGHSSEARSEKGEPGVCERAAARRGTVDGEILTTEYTEAGEPYLKDTEIGLEGLEGLGGKTGLGGLISVREWSDFSV